jgi:hypothetical protein
MFDHNNLSDQIVICFEIMHHAFHAGSFFVSPFPIKITEIISVTKVYSFFMDKSAGGAFYFGLNRAPVRQV